MVKHQSTMRRNGSSERSEQLLSNITRSKKEETLWQSKPHSSLALLTRRFGKTCLSWTNPEFSLSGRATRLPVTSSLESRPSSPPSTQKGARANCRKQILESNTSLARDRIQGWIALHVGDTNKRGSILRDITFCWMRMRARSEFFVTRFPTHQAQPQRRLFETSDTDVPPRFAHA